LSEEVKLTRTQIQIGALVDSIDRRQLRLPEIQRDYVWKPAQIAGLLDSLYREYPSGSILLWETDDAVEERRAKIEPTGAPPAGKSVQYLLNGQQRLTSLHRVFHQPDLAKVVFNVATEKFQIESAATSRDAHWIRVHEVLHASDLYSLIDERSVAVPDVDRNVIGQRLSRLHGIAKYVYHVEVISNLGYDEVTEIFIRVNSRGRALKTTDLALATLSAKWPGVMTKLEDERDYWAGRGYPAFDLAFLARAIAATSTEQRTLSGFKDTPTDELEQGWEATKRGVNHLVKLLDNNAGIETSTLLPSTNALVPIVTYLGIRPDAPLSPDDANALLYWLFGAFITGRYNQSGDTRIAEDAKAVRGPNPLEDLFKNLGLLGERLEVTEQALVGKGAGSSYFILSYLASKRAGATDWYWAVRIGLDATGAAALEYHHIHPQATLKKSYAKAEINDLANLAFISARANKKISNRSPSAYFPEIGEDELRRHFVPLDPALRTADRYPDFVVARRALLADAMSSLLESYRPPHLTGTVVEMAGSSLLLDVTILSDSTEQRFVRFTANVGNGDWSGAVPLADLQRFLSDLEDGHDANLVVGDEVAIVQGGTETLEVPIGPLIVTGTIPEWRDMVERELEAVVEEGDSIATSPAWIGERMPISVVEAQ
jgi:hypothetical protein